MTVHVSRKWMELMLIWNRCGRNTTIGPLKLINSHFKNINRFSSDKTHK